MSSRRKARKDDIYWLIGAGSSSVNSGAKLPSNRQVLAYFLHEHDNNGLTKSESAKVSVGSDSLLKKELKFLLARTQSAG